MKMKIVYTLISVHMVKGQCVKAMGHPHTTKLKNSQKKKKKLLYQSVKQALL